MFHIYIATPSQNNSNYLAHIVEHCVFGKVNTEKFFQSEIITEWTSTYYTYYILDSNDKNELKKFIQQISKKIPNSLIDYEHQVLKKECENNNYNQKLIQRIWQNLYSKNFKYAKAGRKIYSEIQNYHQKHYTPDKIIVLENDTKYFNWKINSKINIIQKLNIKISWDKDTIFIFSHWTIKLYIVSILSDLFDKYLKFSLRFVDGEYNTDSYETIYWDFEKHIFIAIRPDILDKIKNIDDTFIKNYIKYCLQKKTYLQDKDFDGSCMVKYGYTLSNSQKSNILNNIWKYYEIFISQI